MRFDYPSFSSQFVPYIEHDRPSHRISLMLFIIYNMNSICYYTFLRSSVSTKAGYRPARERGIEQDYRGERWIHNSFDYTSVELDRVDLRARQSNKARGNLSRCAALSRGTVRTLPASICPGRPSVNLA